MNTDVYAGPLRTRSAAARAAFAEAVRGLLGHRADTAAHLAAALVADPQLVPAHVVRGFALRSLSRDDLLPELRDIVRTARRHFDSTDPREAALVDALERWVDDDGPGAADLLDAQLSREPRDLLLAKLAHGLRFMLGDTAGMRRSVGVALTGFAVGEPERAWLLGCESFALCESGELSAAERAGHDAIEREPSDVWAIHAVAHVAFMRADHAAGAGWLARHRGALRGGNNFSGHVAWHEALCLVELGRCAEALEILDARVTVYPGADYRETSNACSLLYRLEQRGCDVGDRWDRWVAAARDRVGDHASPFADAHYALVLARAGAAGEAVAWLGSMRQTLASRGQGHDARVGREVAVRLVDALLSARADRIRALRGELARLGGSHAQRALFEWAIERARARALPAAAEA